MTIVHCTPQICYELLIIKSNRIKKRLKYQLQKTFSAAGSFTRKEEAYYVK